jgi:hypothetical protein
MVPEAEKNDKRYRYVIEDWKIIIFVSFLIVPLYLCVGYQ